MQLYDINTSGREAYKKYKKLNKGTKITCPQYRQVVEGCNKLILEELVSGKDVKLNYGLGTITIVKHKPTNYYVSKVTGNKTITLPINWPETRKLWERDPEAGKRADKIYHLNAHTEGYICNFIWYKPKTFSYPTCWDFTEARDAARYLSKVLKTVKGHIHNFTNKFKI